MARQIGELGAQGFAEMASSSRISDNYAHRRLGLGDLTQPMFAWTQVGSIIFPVFTATPISPSPKPVRIENNIARTMEDNLAPAAPHIQSEKRVPTTSALQKIPKVAKSMTSDNGPVPMRKSPPNENTWCSIHKTSQHSLIDCKVILHVKAELKACKNRAIPRTYHRSGA